MIAYRLTRQKYADLTGNGGLYASGRCHQKGTRVIYSSSSRALAILEVLVHIDADDFPLDYVMLEISLPDNIRSKRVPSRVVLAESANPSVSMYIVPSIIIPAETNIIFFPDHPEFSAEIVSTNPFQFDTRLFKRKRTRA